MQSGDKLVQKQTGNKLMLLLQGMEYLHTKRIVHFDLKSANLLLGYKDRRAICKVADFGLSKQKRDTYVSNVSSQRGTLPWIAPEIIKTPNAVTEKVCRPALSTAFWSASRQCIASKCVPIASCLTVVCVTDSLAVLPFVHAALA